MVTFVLRVFVPATSEEQVLTGIVEHSSSGRCERFRGVDGLAAALLAELRQAGATVVREGCDQEREASGVAQADVLEHGLDPLQPSSSN